MNSQRKVRVLGAVAGATACLALGLPAITATGVAAEMAPSGPPLSPAVTAPARALGAAFAAVAAHVRPAVVSVYSEKNLKYQAMDMPFGDDFLRQFFGQQPAPSPRQQPREYRIPQRGMGSGIILDRKGHILTNNHVVQDVDEIKVQLADTRVFEAEVVGADARTDVAVIRIKGKVPDDLPVAEFGDSDALQVGDLVLAIGAPFGLTQTVTEGIISAVGRADVGIADYEDFLQTDAAINPGNSGGPLVNMSGEVIGMNGAIAGSLGQFAGVGFAIPANMINAILPTLLKGGTVTRGMIGVVIQDINKELAGQFKLSDTKGALVSQVNKDSPAEKAGIKVGDVIVKYNGKDIADTRHLRNMAAATAPGTKVKVIAMRNGKQETFTVTIGTLTAETEPEGGQPAEEGGSALAKLGLTVQTLTPELAKQFKADADTGVLVSTVAEGSLASLGGMQAGDVITEANRQKVANTDELQRVLAKSDGSVLFLIKRKGASLFVALQGP